MVKRRRIGVVGESTDGRSAAGEKQSLEAQADERLSEHGFALGNIRLFTERKLLRKILREAEWAPRTAEDGLPDEVFDYLIERHMSHIKAAGLTRLQLRIYELFLRGMAVTEIASRLRLSRQRVSKAIQAARSEALKRRSKYEGLQEVYWREVRRYVYRKPRHGWRESG
ncbi:MAG: hypothetical protein Q7T82_00880 [Armatimonadota bacterium]|nr:hypothetical protein [Armatimonadota bacterium]